MTADGWVLATDTDKLSSMVAAVRAMGGDVTILAVGPRALAETAAAMGAHRVAWIETADDVPSEGYAATVGQALAAARPRLVLATTTPQGRALLGAAAAALGAVVVAGVVAIRVEDESVVVDRTDLDGRVIETLATTAPVAALFAGAAGEVAAPALAAPAPIERLAAEWPSGIRIEKAESVGAAGNGVADAERVVAVGRGVRAQADLAMVEDLAAALGAVIGCSMPIADDFGWVAKESYIGRSGQHISPRLYLALGISGAPQHLDGVRDAKTVVAVNIDPEAPIFRRADYGIVGDLYEVIPQLQAALAAARP